jgi:hypothetical protein
MSGTQATDMDHEESGESEEGRAPEKRGLDLASLGDFKSVDCEAPLAETRTVNCFSLGEMYRKAAEATKKDGNEAALRVYSLLQAVTQIHFKPHDRAEPYGPILVMDGRRSVIPDDLRGEQSAVFAEIAPVIKNAGLRARLADIAWLNDRKLYASAQLAISSYIEAVRMVMEGKATLFFDEETATSHNSVDLLRRACQIANHTGWKAADADPLKTLISDIRQAAFASHDASGYIRIGQLSLDYETCEPIDVAIQADNIAELEGAHPDTERLLWELAARAYRHCGMEDESPRCLVSAAECYAKMADAAASKGMVAASWLMTAIKALRGLRGTKERRQELEARLREAQASISDEMSVISVPLDLSKIADDSRKATAGLPLVKALFGFATADTSPTPEKLRERALSQGAENPLSAIIPMGIHDDEGKLVAQSPGLGTDADETAIRHLILRDEALRREITAKGTIEPARRVIVAEHGLNSRHFMPIVELSPFVPAGYEDIFAVGFARFIGGDFVSALHTLVPQLENSLRHILKLAAIDPSSIKNDMTQENRTLSTMLDKDRAALEKIFGPAIVFEIENLFDFRGGPALRHEIAHGMVSWNGCHGPDAIYACWFIYKLCCLPLFPHYDHMTEIYAKL